MQGVWGEVHCVWPRGRAFLSAASWICLSTMAEMFFDDLILQMIASSRQVMLLAFEGACI